MENHSALHKTNFVLCCLFVFLVGISWLIIGVLAELYLLDMVIVSLDIMMISFEFFLRYLLLPVIFMFILVYLLFKISFFHFKTAFLFIGDIDDCWNAFSRLVIRDAVLLFIIGIVGMIISFSSYELANEIDAGNYTDDLKSGLIGSLLFISTAIFFVNLSSMISNQSILGVSLLIIRNLVRLILLALFAMYLVAALSEQQIDGLFLIMIIIIVDGVSQLMASCLLLYYKIREDVFDNQLNDEEFSHYEIHNINSSSRHIDLPGKFTRGTFDDDGFEWIEYPSNSEIWYWREEDFGEWVKY